MIFNFCRSRIRMESVLLHNSAHRNRSKKASYKYHHQTSTIETGQVHWATPGSGLDTEKL